MHPNTLASLIFAYAALGDTTHIKGEDDTEHSPPPLGKPKMRSLLPRSNADPPVMPGTISTCDSYYLVKQGDTCQNIVNEYRNFTLADFYSWNPAVGNDCLSLLLDNKVCIGASGTPSLNTNTTNGTSATPDGPTKPGIIATCTGYYPVVTGDTCIAIAARFQITVPQIEAWNPDVGPNCAIDAGFSYCVAGPAPKHHTLTTEILFPTMSTTTTVDAIPT